MAEPIKNVKFGGVNYNANDVTKHSVKTDANGKKTYSVFLKNGVKIEYPEQNPQNNARLCRYELGFWDSLSDDTATGLWRLDRAKVTGTSEDDLIYMNECTNCQVDISKDDNDDRVIIDGFTVNTKRLAKGRAHLSKDNEIILDKHDELTIYKPTAPGRESRKYGKKEIDGPGVHRE